MIMLLVVYGLTLNVGDKTRKYLQSKGFKIIKKTISEENDNVVKSYFVNRELSEQKLLNNVILNIRLTMVMLDLIIQIFLMQYMVKKMRFYQ